MGVHTNFKQSRKKFDWTRMSVSVGFSAKTILKRLKLFGNDGNALRRSSWLMTSEERFPEKSLRRTPLRKGIRELNTGN